MDNQKKLPSILFSLIVHALLLLSALLTMHKSNNILSPSRSNGIQVELISLEQTAPVKEQNLVKSTESIKTMTNNAEININKTKNEEYKVQELKQNPEIKETKPTENNKILTKHEKKPKQETAKQVNDLLHGLESKNGHNKGASTNGTDAGTSNSNSLIANYADLVIERVRPFVNIPNNMDNNSFAIVEVTLLPNMQLYQLKLIKSSGNNEYDDSVQNAIKRGASVFPPLPAGANWADFQTIKLTFRPY